ncbi:conserved hypothetical protein [Perkinsus marinus ATCC 50983]|uniref:VTT domain-containing protein n=1 Tax=Perkinsus marinus (strain ATCC 50983 / TXsc) TaxID=423536 RepID=C5KI30_PERM5|nr:conserved hypothetical protein [Perkinsus marinus ATCC 50983]EER16242.1 conserved hypothetical protein [Perkinsus marinus ATCC 50983]|eukprot:XP_002784446.1 conserved hypothetical protein [Perkinsus marinus ATCC 50983]
MDNVEIRPRRSARLAGDNLEESSVISGKVETADRSCGEEEDKSFGSYMTSLVLLLTLLATSLCMMWLLYQGFPPLSKLYRNQLHTTFGDKSFTQLLTNTTGQDMLVVQETLEFYIEGHYTEVLLLFCASYTFLQTFAIPGPIFLSLLAGALFGRMKGFFLVSTCATAGATLCYTLFRVVGRPVVMHFFRPAMTRFKRQLDKRRDSLFWYMLFLRITPIVPNWFINISTGNLGLNSRTFFFGTLLGLIPNNIILVNMGSELAEIQHVGSFNAKNFLVLLGLGCLALIPTLLKRQLSTDENDDHLLVPVAADHEDATKKRKN